MPPRLNPPATLRIVIRPVSPLVVPAPVVPTPLMWPSLGPRTYEVKVQRPFSVWTDRYRVRIRP